jgi:uncharacterized sulfatase
MKKLGITLAVVAIIALVAWQNRLAILMTAVPIMADITDPIGPNREVLWDRGPDAAELPPAERPPNIIVILADDMGFIGVSFYNGGAADGSVQTPHIDAIANNGVAFMNGYSGNAVCAPSRAAIVSGRYSTRFGFEFTPFPRIAATINEWMASDEPGALPSVINRDRLDELPEMQHLGMPPSEITIAEMLQTAGYHTTHIGKWHLGSANGMHPVDQGFDESLYMSGMLYDHADSEDSVGARVQSDPIDNMVWTVARYSATFNDGPTFEPRGYLTDYYTDEAVKVIEANRNRPFFLYLAHWGIHNPLQASRADYEALSHIEDHKLRVYAAMIRALDRGVGRVMEALRKHGLEENTLVIFTSDNGGAEYIDLPMVNQPYRGWKLTLFEGGTHVPYFAQWPAKFEAGTRFEHPVSHIDILPTAVSAAKGSLPTDRIIDGVDLTPFITGERIDPPHRTLFWRQGYYQVVLHDGWKYMVSDRPDTKWLFNLNEDPTEQVNLAVTQTGRAESLQALLDAHNAEQADPAWPSVLEMPVLVDKTGAGIYEEGDEYVYFPN